MVISGGNCARQWPQTQKVFNTCIGSVGKSPHLETGINQLDSWHDILHAVVDVAVSASLCSCQDFMQVLQKTQLPL